MPSVGWVPSKAQQSPEAGRAGGIGCCRVVRGGVGWPQFDISQWPCKSQGLQGASENHGFCPIPYALHGGLGAGLPSGLRAMAAKKPHTIPSCPPRDVHVCMGISSRQHTHTAGTSVHTRPSPCPARHPLWFPERGWGLEMGLGASQALGGSRGCRGLGKRGAPNRPGCSGQGAELPPRETDLTATAYKKIKLNNNNKIIKLNKNLKLGLLWRNRIFFSW